jgi:hypothetical protein
MYPTHWIMPTISRCAGCAQALTLMSASEVFMSYLTDEEQDALEWSGLEPWTPFVIQDVSRTQLSVARHYGGCLYRGKEYVYLPTTDELVRDDVVRWIATRRKEEQQAVKQQDDAQQLDML